MGKGRLFSDSSNDDVYRDEADNENFVLGSQQNAQGLGGGVFNDSSGYGNFSQSGRDQRNADLNGALFRGNLGFILDTAVLDVTTSTINLLEDSTSTALPRASIDKIVTLSTGDTSDLITILGAQRTGQRLRLYNIDTNTITIKNTGAATDNTILTPDAVDFVLSGNAVIDLTYDITTAKWRIVGGTGGGTPGTSFPILYPKADLTPAIDGTATIDVSLETGNAKQIQFPAGDISFAITGDPANTVGEDFYVVFLQDSVGGRSLTSVDSRIKDGGLMDTLLDKAPDAHTLFRFATLGGGTVYHPILVNLSTSTATNLSVVAIDVDKDWAGRFITNLAGLDLFANSVANNITNMGVLTFVSDAAATRGQFGRSDFFAGASDGLVTNIPNTANISWSVDLVEKFRLDAPNDKLISSIDLDMNEFDIFNIDQTRFIESSGAVSAVTDSVILLNSSSHFQFNTSETNDFVFSLQNIPAFVIDRVIPTSDTVIATIQGDNTNINSTANLNLTRTFEPGSSLQIIGQIGFNAPDDTNAGTLEYAAIVGKIEDASDSSIDGSLSFDVTLGNAPTPFMILNKDNFQQVDIFTDLDMNTNDILMGTGGNITSGGAGEGMTNIGHLDFVDNVSTPVAALSIYSNGLDMLVNTGGGVVNLSDVGDGIFLDSTFRILGSGDQTKELAFEVDTNVPTSSTVTMTIPSADGTIFVTPAIQTLDMNSNSITNASFIESDTANRPGSGFVRMATADEIRMRNPTNADDLVITSGNDAIGNQALLFQVASGDRLTVSQFDIDVIQNDIINTGDVLPSGTGGEVGDSTNFYNQMHSQFFIPEPASVLLGRYGLAKTGNTLYVNFDDTNADAGFSVYEQGFESFRFYNPDATTNEIHIGSSSVFTSGETYRIQMGENSNSSAKIEFTEGANDLFIDRQGVATTQSVALSTGSTTRFKVNVNEAQLFVPLNANAQDLFNVVDIKSNGGGGATTGTIGEVISSNGGFDYYLRDKIFWDTDPDTFIQFQTNGIFIESDDNVSILAPNATSDVTIRAGTGSSFFNLGLSGINHLQFSSGVTTFSTANIFLATGTEYISFLIAASGTTLDTPASGDINLFNDLDTGELSVKKFGGTVVSLEGGGGIAFPIDFPEETDRGIVTTDQIIDFADSTRHSIAMTVGTPTISLDIQNQPTDELALSSITMAQDSTGGRTFTFLDTVANSQTIIDAFDALAASESISFMLEWERGVFTAYLKTGNIVSGGGGSLSEPIELGFNEAVVSTTTIVAGDVFNPTHISLTQSTTIQLDISDTTSKYKSIFIIFDTTGSSFTVTWPASVANPPIIDDSIAQRISVILYTIDNGTTWTHATSVGSSTGGEFFGPWSANHDAGIFSLTNLAASAYVDTGGLSRGTIFGDVSNSALGISVASGGKLHITDVLTPILEIDDTTGLRMLGTHVINMGGNVINTIAELQFDNVIAHTPSNENTIAFDPNDDALKYSVALTTDTHRFYADTDLLATISRVGTNEGLLSIQAVTGAFLQATQNLFLSTFNNTTLVNGEIWRDSGDGKFKFRENNITQELGSQSSIADGDSNVTVTDSVPEITFTLNASQVGKFSSTAFLPAVPIDMTASSTNPNIIGLGKLQFTENNDTLFSTQTIITARNTDANLLFNVGVGSDTFDFSFAGTTEWIFSNTQLSGNNIILDNTLTINDGVANPAGNGQFARNGDILGLQIPEFAVRRSTIVAADAPELSLVRDDANPDPFDTVGEISFKVDDSGVLTTYAAITSTIIDATDNAAMTFLLRADNGLISALALQGDDNNQRFQMLCSGTSQFRIQPVFDRMGYFVTPQVTDFSLVLGTNGSLEIPVIANGSPSVNDLNSGFGSFDNAIGYESVDERIYVRESATRWVFFAAAGAVT